MQKLLKPLEPVEEELLEASEITTPASEVIDMTRKKRGSTGLKAKKSSTQSMDDDMDDREQTSLMSSHRNS
jgi:hypothetical protein